MKKITPFILAALLLAATPAAFAGATKAGSISGDFGSSLFTNQAPAALAEENQTDKAAADVSRIAPAAGQTAVKKPIGSASKILLREPALPSPQEGVVK